MCFSSSSDSTPFPFTLVQRNDNMSDWIWNLSVSVNMFKVIYWHQSKTSTPSWIHFSVRKLLGPRRPRQVMGDWHPQDSRNSLVSAGLTKFWLMDIALKMELRWVPLPRPLPRQEEEKNEQICFLLSSPFSLVLVQCNDNMSGWIWNYSFRLWVKTKKDSISLYTRLSLPPFLCLSVSLPLSV